MEKKKILILTLGVGNLLGKTQGSATDQCEDNNSLIQRMIEEDIYPYDKTKYSLQLPGRETDATVESEYVAEVQTMEFQPDMIILIGTVKSGWSMFYRKFTQKSSTDDTDKEAIDKKTIKEDVLKLYEMEQEYGKDTSDDQLKECEKQIQKIYDKKLRFNVKAPDGKQQPIETKICLIRYGINNQELLENYRSISSIEQYLEKDVEYEVAFDITHSFRSLPIYNLIILNYLRQVSSYKIHISHIFYGNFDVKRENNGIAPLVDLADMSEILELTNAVSEFKNTGNATSLMRLLPQSEEDLINALARFDWATQINGRDEVISAITELVKVLQDNSDERNKYVDVKKMLRTVLGEGENNLLQIADCDNKGEAQLLLAQWYQRQNRYGLAVTTAMEALRSFLVPFLQSSNGTAINVEDETQRKIAVQKLDVIKSNKDRWIDSDITDFLAELERFRKEEVAPMRNVFAHNLQDKRQSDMNSSKEIINEFLNKLTILKNFITERTSDFEAVYTYKLTPQNISKKTGDHVRVFLTDQAEELSNSMRNTLFHSNSADYDVYRLPEIIAGKIRKPKMSNEEILSSESLLSEYLKTHFDVENVQIIIDDRMNSRKRMNYALFLFQSGFKTIGCLQKTKVDPMPKLVVDFEIPEIKESDKALINQEPERFTNSH